MIQTVKVLRGRFLWVPFIGPFALALTLLLVVPFVNLVVFSFLTYSPTRIAVPEFTLQNYAALWDSYFFWLFLRTMRLGLVTTLVCVTFAFPVAYFLARARPRYVAVGLFLLVMPLMVSAVIRIFGWVVILGRRGLVNQALAALGFDAPIPLLYTEGAVVIGLASVVMPFMALPIMSSIERIPRSLEEAAANLGASRFSVFRAVIVPLSLPGIISGGLLVYAVSISAYVVPALMGGPKNRMIGSQIFDLALVSFNWPGASAIALVLVVITLILLFSAIRATRRWQGTSATP